MLQTGQTLRVGAQGLVVESHIGGGGQGDVYRANLEGWPCALKWYSPQTIARDLTLRKRLITTVLSRPPSEEFLWPMDLAEGAPGRFGYVMPLRGPEFCCDLNDVLKARGDPSFRVIATAGLYLAHSFLLLHAKGLCYRDLNLSNVFLDPETGDVRICDNDNVAPVGEPSGIWGTHLCMAPEVFVRHAPHSVETDLHSLAVLLFYMHFLQHPLDGRATLKQEFNGRQGERRLYGEEAVFIFDPHNRSNEPISGKQDGVRVYWSLYPRFLKDLFIRTFTTGLADPSERVRESEWRQAMAQLADGILLCQSCEAENFMHGALKDPGHCWRCTRQLRQPPRLILLGRPFALVGGAKLRRFHLDGSFFHDPFSAIGEVMQGRGLRNLSGQSWEFTAPNESAREIVPGDVVPLVHQSVVRFGRTKGQIATD